MYIYFINHCLSASLLRPDGIKHNIHDTHAHINNTQHMDHKTQPPDDAPHASPRVASHAGPCATPFHTWGVARGPAGGCFTPWSPYHPKPLPYRALAVPSLLIPPAPAAPHGDHWRGGTPPALSAAARWDAFQNATATVLIKYWLWRLVLYTASAAWNRAPGSPSPRPSPGWAMARMAARASFPRPPAAVMTNG